MSMTTDEFGSLLKQINAADPKFKIDDPGKVAMWWKVATEARWTWEGASRAVVEFFALPADPTKGDRWIDPGNITYLIRSKRSGPAPAAQVAGQLTRGRPSSPEHRARLREQLAAELEARNVSSSVQARVPWHDGPVREDVDDDVVVISSSPEERRALMHAIKGKPARGLAEAFTGRPR